MNVLLNHQIKVGEARMYHYDFRAV